jgi:hypothetical protein
MARLIVRYDLFGCGFMGPDPLCYPQTGWTRIPVLD